MDSLRNFILMGGYGGYVWSSYAIMLAVFVGLWLLARHGKQCALRRIAKAGRREDTAL